MGASPGMGCCTIWERSNSTRVACDSYRHKCCCRPRQFSCSQRPHRWTALHVLTYDTLWTTKKGLITKDLYHYPLQGQCECKCQFLVCSSILQTQLLVKSKHVAALHANDTSKGLTYVQQKTIEQAVRLAPLQSVTSQGIWPIYRWPSKLSGNNIKLLVVLLPPCNHNWQQWSFVDSVWTASMEVWMNFVSAIPSQIKYACTTMRAVRTILRSLTCWT